MSCKQASVYESYDNYLDQMQEYYEQECLAIFGYCEDEHWNNFRYWLKGVQNTDLGFEQWVSEQSCKYRGL